jgi:O-antigen/teichoic acid export membrane protein
MIFKNRIFKNTLWLFSSELVTRILKFFLIVYIARILGATEYGKFSFALNFVALVGLLGDFGLSTIITREFSKDPSKKQEYFSSLLTLKMFLIVLSFVFINIIGFFIAPSLETRKIVFILSFYSIFSSLFDFNNAFFRAYQKMNYEAIGKILCAVITAILGFFFLFKLPSIENMSYAYLLGILFAVIFGIFVLAKKFFCFKLGFDKNLWKEFLSLSWPLAFIAFFGSIYHYLDSIMLGAWGFLKENGFYNAAYRILDISIVPGYLISISFFPELSRKIGQGEEKKTFLVFLSTITILAIPLALGGFFLSERIINFFYGPDYKMSILALKILIFTALIIYLSFPLSRALVSFNLQNIYFLITFIGALLNILLNFLLIPKYTLYGASTATLITYIFVTLLYFAFLHKKTKLSVFEKGYLKTFFISIFSSSLMVVFLKLPALFKLNIIFLVFIGTIFYFAIFYLLFKIFKVRLT